jgi:hypothetical protein
MKKMVKKWTTEEKAFLTMHLNKKPKQIVKRFHTKFGTGRTYQSIYGMVSSLRTNVLKQPLKKNSMKVSINKPAKSPKPRKTRKTGYSAKRWTRNEDNYLKEISSLDELERASKEMGRSLLAVKNRFYGKGFSFKQNALKQEVDSSDRKKTNLKLAASKVAQLVEQKKEDIKILRNKNSLLEAKSFTLTQEIERINQSWAKKFEEYTIEVDRITSEKIAEARKERLSWRERRKLKKAAKLQKKLDKLNGE